MPDEGRGIGLIRVEIRTSAFALDPVLDAADAVLEARLRRPQALVRCAQVLEFLREPLLQRRELLCREGVQVDGVA